MRNTIKAILLFAGLLLPINTFSAKDMVIIQNIVGRSDSVREALNTTKTLVYLVEEQRSPQGESQLRRKAEQISKHTGERVSVSDAYSKLSERDVNTAERKYRHQYHSTPDMVIVDDLEIKANDNEHVRFSLAGFVAPDSDRGQFFTVQWDQRILSFAKDLSGILAKQAMGLPRGFEAIEGIVSKNPTTTRPVVQHQGGKLEIELKPEPLSRPFMSGKHMVYPITRKWVFSRDSNFDLFEESWVTGDRAYSQRFFEDYREFAKIPSLRLPTSIQILEQDLVDPAIGNRMYSLQRLEQEPTTSGTLYGMLITNYQLDEAIASLVQSGFRFVQRPTGEDLARFPLTETALVESDKRKAEKKRRSLSSAPPKVLQDTKE